MSPAHVKSEKEKRSKKNPGKNTTEAYTGKSSRSPLLPRRTYLPVSDDLTTETIRFGFDTRDPRPTSLLCRILLRVIATLNTHFVPVKHMAVINRESQCILRMLTTIRAGLCSIFKTASGLVLGSQSQALHCCNANISGMSR